MPAQRDRNRHTHSELFEAGCFQIEIEVEHRQVTKLFREQAVIPLGVLGQTIVRDRKSAELCLTQVVKRDRWDLPAADQFASHRPAVPCDNA